VPLYCLVRGKTEEEARERLVQDLKVAELWKEEYLERLKVLKGSLEAPNFGLDDA
jgi:thioester reductase-like protein